MQAVHQKTVLQRKIKKTLTGKNKHEGPCFCATTHCYWKYAKELLEHIENFWNQRQNSSCWTKRKTENNGQDNIPSSCIQDGHIWAKTVFVKSNEKEVGIIDPRLQRAWNIHIHIHHGSEHSLIFLRTKLLFVIMCLSYKLLCIITRKEKLDDRKVQSGKIRKEK